MILPAVYGDFHDEISGEGETYSVHGPCNMSPEVRNFLTCDELAVYNALAGLDSKFVYLHDDDMVYSTVYGYNFYDHGRFNTSATYEWSFKGEGLHAMVTTDEAVINPRCSGGMEHSELECPGSDWKTGDVCHGVEFGFWCFLLFETT